VTALFISLSLSACELRPLYATDAASATSAPVAELASIQVARVTGNSGDRTGLLLRNALLDRLNPRGEPSRPRYRLDIVLEEFREGAAITRSDEATRTNLVIAARYRLVDLATNQAVHANEARNATAYNILRADFGNIAAEQDARQRLSRELAEAIRTGLASWLARPTVPRS